MSGNPGQLTVEFMQACDRFIKNLAETLPNLCKVQDLIDAGIFSNRYSAAYARKTKMGPPHIKLAYRVVYPKEGVIEWLKECQNADEEECETLEDGTHYGSQAALERAIKAGVDFPRRPSDLF